MKNWVIARLDNDTAGKRATGNLIAEISDAELEQDYVVDSRLYGGFKDANEILINDREGFKEWIEKILIIVRNQ